MQKSPMSNLPGAGAIHDPLEFVKTLWGSMSVPGMGPLPSMAPAMSVEDLDKKIADLKTVETWLNMNMSMLRGTIHTLEVQRGTMVTLKSMSAAFAAAIKQPDGASAGASPYASFFGQPAVEPSPAAPKRADTKPDAPKDPLPAAATAAMTNPTAWWNMLQDQFTQAVATAMTPDAVANAGKPPEAAAPASKAAPAGEQAPLGVDEAADRTDGKRAAGKRTKGKNDGDA